MWSTKSLKLIFPPLWFINRFPVDLRYSIIFNESIEVPLGRIETENLFGLQVKLTITIVFRSVGGQFGLFLPFTIKFFRELFSGFVLGATMRRNIFQGMLLKLLATLYSAFLCSSVSSEGTHTQRHFDS